MAAQLEPSCFDALGTLLTFEPPAPHLRRGAARARRRRRRRARGRGRDPGRDRLLPRASATRAATPTSLLDLRRACAEAMGPVLPGSPRRVAARALLAALRFFAYPDAAPALRALRDAGIRLVVVSNWDWSLHERLAETGLAPLVDGAVASAEVGSAKPDRRHLPARARARRRAPATGAGTSATRPRRTSTARWPRACGPCWSIATAAAGAPGVPRSRSLADCPALGGCPADERRRPRSGPEPRRARAPAGPSPAVARRAGAADARAGLPAWPPWAPFAACSVA